MPAAADDTLQASVEPAAGPSVVEAYLNAFALLDRHEIVAARDHAVDPVLRRGGGDPPGAHARAARRHRGSGARRDHRQPRRGRPRLRAVALRAADPGGLARRRRRARDHRRRRPGDRCRRAVPGAGLRAVARARRGAGDRSRGDGAARARREILDDAGHARRTADRGRGPGGGRTRDPAPQGRQRHQARIRRARRPLPASGRRRQCHAHLDRGDAVAGLGARRGRQAHLRQRRLCARRRRQGHGRSGRARHRAVRSRRPHRPVPRA